MKQRKTPATKQHSIFKHSPSEGHIGPTVAARGDLQPEKRSKIQTIFLFLKIRYFVSLNPYFKGK
ncbi:hypothetical protein AM501_11425 [Aneurinibacillus migulanus]|nr:hypothetical protein TS64_04715 [Aneurinibacillus migulanus]KPD08157.1 hypothetical protein AM501_11425 [Aneurinibacillus migulanus]